MTNQIGGGGPAHKQTLQNNQRTSSLMAGKFVHTMPPHHFELLRGEATDPKSYDVFGVNMIVNRSRELGVLKSKVLGSVSQKVFNHADCSVVTVR
jgi:hypothetical protein